MNLSLQLGAPSTLTGCQHLVSKSQQREHKIEATKEPDSPDIQPRNPGHLNSTPMRGLLSSSWRPARTGTQTQSLSLQDSEGCVRARTHTHTHTHTHSGAVGRAVSHLGPSGEKQQQACHSPGLLSAWLRSVEGQTAGPGLLALPRIMGPARRKTWRH